MSLVEVLQYIFLASIAFDFLVGVWFVYNSWRSGSFIIHVYYSTLSLILSWEFVTYVSFFVQRSMRFDFIFNASTFTLGFFCFFSVIFFMWNFFERKHISRLTITLLFLTGCVTTVLAYVPGLVVGPKIFATNSQIFYLANAPLTVVFYLLLLMAFIVLCVLLYNGYKQTSDRKKQEAKIMILGFGLASAAAILAYVLVPLLSKLFVSKSDMIVVSIVIQQVVAGVSVSLISLNIAYAILRYRIFNIKYQIKRHIVIVTVYSLLCLLVLPPFYFLILRTNLGISWLIMIVASVLYLTLLFFYRKKINNLLYRLIPQQVIDFYDLSDKDRLVINSVPTVEQFVLDAVCKLSTRLRCSRISLYVLNPRAKCFVEIYPYMGFKLSSDKAYAAWNSERYAMKQLTDDLSCERLVFLEYENDLLGIVTLNCVDSRQGFSAEEESFLKSYTQFLGYNLWNYLQMQHYMYMIVDRQHSFRH